MSAKPQVLGKIIREKREQRNLSQEGLAALSGLSRTFVGEIERGDAGVSWSSLVAIADGLGVRLSEIIHEYEQRAGG